MSRDWDDQPNRQKAIETTIPTLSGILLGMAGALFVAVAVAEFEMLRGALCFRTLIFVDAHILSIPLARRTLIMIATALTGICFYFAMVYCIWAQMSNYDHAGSNNQDVQPPSMKDRDDWQEWMVALKYWEDERKKYAARALLLFNIGIQLIFLPLTFLLPAGIFELSFYLWLLSWIIFFLRWRRSPDWLSKSPKCQ